MSSEGENQILATIFKLNKPFKVTDIVEETDMAKQLVSYHLNKFVAWGAIEHHNRLYVVTDRDILMDKLTASQVENERKLPKPTNIVGSETIGPAIRVARAIAYGQVLNVPEIKKLRVLFVTDIDNSVRALKQLKRWLVYSKIQSERNARKFLKDVDPHLLYNLFESFGESLDMDEDEFVSEFEDCLQQVD